MDEFSPSLMQLWKKWNVRVTVLLSFTLQVVLIVLGNRRNHNSMLWIRIVTWCAYLSADVVATFALGIITNNMSHFYEKKGGSRNVDSELTAFWAPFLLMHLGGPDTITAYSLEDNELWLRHLLGLIVQMVMAIYVCVMAWTGSLLSFLSVIMTFVGLIKYGERTWVLRKACLEKVRESFANRPPFLDVVNFGNSDLSRAYHIMDWCFQPLFLDLNESVVLNYIFRQLPAQETFQFQIIEMSLAFMYNNLYTKALLIYSHRGLGLRVITVILTSFVSVLFPVLIQKHKFSKIDVTITFILLFGAIILEIYSALLLLFSDRFQVWLITHRKRWSDRFEAFKGVLPKKKRWSNKMSQLSLLSFCTKEKPLPCRNFLKHFGIVEKLENYWYVADIEIPNNLKKLMLTYLNTKKDPTTRSESLPIDLRRIDFTESLCTPLRGIDFTEELEKSVLAWHIATERFYEIEREDVKGKWHVIELICQISRYMFSLLVLHPNMLSNANTATFTLQPILVAARDSSFKSRIEASKNLLPLIQSTMLEIRMVEKGNLTGFNRSIRDFFEEDLPKLLERLDEKSFEERWMIISCTWLEMLPYAAFKCRGMYHAQQLKCGGEFLTHIWLLTKWFQFTDKDFTSHAPRWASSIIGLDGASLERPDLSGINESDISCSEV